MNPEIEACLKEHTKVHTKAIDWLIASWEKQGTEKELCLERYKSNATKAHKLVKRLDLLWKKHQSNLMRN